MVNTSLAVRVHDEIPAPSFHNVAEPAALVLDQEGRIHECNEPAETLFGFRHDELLSRPIALLLPQLRDVEWLQNGTLNPRMSFYCQIGRHFSAVRRDGTLFASRLFFHDLDNGKNPRLRLIIRRAESME